MKSRILLPRSDPWEFEDLYESSARKWTVGAARSIENIISSHIFWIHSSFYGLFPENVFETYPGILLLAEKLMVPRQDLMKDTKYQHKQFFYYYSAIWKALIEKDCVSLFDVYSINQSTREIIFRHVSNLVVQLLKDYKSSNMSKELLSSLEQLLRVQFLAETPINKSKLPIYFLSWVCTVREILTNIYYAEELNAAVLWNPKAVGIVNWLVHYLNERKGTNLAYDTNLPCSVVYYRSILPHVPPYEVEIIANLKEDEKIRMLRSHLLNTEHILQKKKEFSDWVEEFNSISARIEAKLRRERIVTSLTGAIGIGEAALGALNIIPGFLGLGIALTTPVINRLMKRPLKKIEDQFPFYTEVFRLKNHLYRQKESYVKKNKEETRRATYIKYNPESFLKSLKYTRIERESTQYCVGITKSGSLCKRMAKDNEFFCSLHSS